MPVIIDMDMPRSCADCPMCHCKGKDEPWNYSCFATMEDINIEEWDKERYITCPLKSADEMIAEIKQLSNDLEKKDDYDDYSVKYLDQSIGVDLALEIINKYCKENKNG